MDAIGQIGKKFRKKDEARPFLTDDIIMNILSRLLAKNAMQCRLVCSRWRDLTMDRDFVDLHYRNRIPPMILVANPRYNSGLDLFALDKWWEPARKKLMFHKFPFYSGNLPNTVRALFSHAGLIAFRHYHLSHAEHTKFMILNPSSLENVQITISQKFSEVYGVFFHPAINEYLSLWIIGSPLPMSGSLSLRYDFKILNLGPNPRFKSISYPFDHKYKWSGSYTVFIDKHLYWMLEPEGTSMIGDYTCNDIMEYSIVSEEFRVIPCQFPLGSLLNIDGTLSYVSICPTKITIWKLEHPADQLWTSNEYTFGVEIFEPRHNRGWWEGRRATALVDGKLAVMSDRRLHVCNLAEGTVKNYQKGKYCHNVLFLSHQMSLASLRNCKRTIIIDQDGNVVAS